MRKRKMCPWCERNGRSYSNGLCIKCHTIPEARLAHPYQFKGKKQPFKPEPTMAELDALIAEQMKDLPPWWWKEHEKADAEMRRGAPCEKLQNNKVKKSKTRPTKFKSLFINGRK